MVSRVCTVNVEEKKIHAKMLCFFKIIKFLVSCYCHSSIVRCWCEPCPIILLWNAVWQFKYTAFHLHTVEALLLNGRGIHNLTCSTAPDISQQRVLLTTQLSVSWEAVNNGQWFTLLLKRLKEKKKIASRRECRHVFLELCTADRKYSSLQMVGLIESDFFRPANSWWCGWCSHSHPNMFVTHMQQSRWLEMQTDIIKAESSLICLQCEWRWYARCRLVFRF